MLIFNHIFPIKHLFLIFCWLSQNVGLFYASECFIKLLYSTAPMDFLHDVWILIFLCEFLVLLKGVTKFLKDFTGEEPPFHLWFPRIFLFCWFLARAFGEKIQVR